MALAVGGLVLLVWLAWTTRGRWRRFGLPMLGVALLVAFVLVRVPSHHASDDWLRTHRVAPWLMELGGIGLVVLGALLGRRDRGP